MVLLIDTANIYMRNAYKLGHLTTSQDIPSGALYGTIRSVKALEDRFNPEEIVFALEAGGKRVREAIDSQYKAHRPQGLLADEVQLGSLMVWVLTAGFSLAYSPKTEADDVIAHLAQEHGAHTDVIIVSTDRDFRQLITDRVSLCPEGVKPLYTSEDFAQTYPCRPSEYWKVRALSGDASDNIVGIPMVGEKTAIKIASECEWEWGAILDHPKVSPYQELVCRNRQLLEFLPADELKVEKGHRNSKALQFFYEQWEFHSLAKKRN